MTKENQEKETTEQENTNTETSTEQTTTNIEDNKNDKEEGEEKETTEQIIEDAKGKSIEAELQESKDKYMRLYAEFDNFRRRTNKEKGELIKNAGADLMQALLPILDDFERANKSMTESKDVEAVKQGLQLVYEKLIKTLENKGLKAMEASIGKEFDLELHESITQIPAPSEDMKGKVMDEIEKGYYLNEKILRFAKVVIGS